MDECLCVCEELYKKDGLGEKTDGLDRLDSIPSNQSNLSFFVIFS